jgi:G:T-mismatch repair DNA endonuclease (very short patch repair protein)
MERDLVAFLRTLNLSLIVGDRSLISPLELDVIIPDFNVAIEFNGVFWHNGMNKYKEYHRDKRLKCEAKGIRLITIWEDEWATKKDKIQAYLKSVFGLKEVKVPARKCRISEVAPKEAIKFLDANHLQGYGVVCPTYIGLYFDNLLVALMSFRGGFSSVANIELQRYVTLSGHSVQGGFSRLLSHWRLENYDKTLVSYIDLDKFVGKSYELSGFKKTSETISMSYVHGTVRYPRQKFMKKNLTNLPGYSENKTELEICAENKIYPVWNSGTATYFLDSVL